MIMILTYSPGLLGYEEFYDLFHDYVNANEEDSDSNVALFSSNPNSVHECC